MAATSPTDPNKCWTTTTKSNLRVSQYNQQHCISDIGESISTLQRNDQQFHTTEQDAGHPWQRRPGDSSTSGWQPWENRKSFFQPWTATGGASN